MGVRVGIGVGEGVEVGIGVAVGGRRGVEVGVGLGEGAKTISGRFKFRLRMESAYSTSILGDTSLAC